MKKNLIVFLLYFLTTNCKWAEQVLENLTLEEKIAQLFIIGVANEEHLKKLLQENNQKNNAINPSNKLKVFNRTKAQDLINKYKIGGIHLICYKTIKSYSEDVNYFQSISKFPLLVSIDAETGLQMDDAIKFPKNLDLGFIQDNNLIYELAKEIGRQCKLLGVHINFAPVVDINNNPKNIVIGARSFSENKEVVAQKAASFINGLQDSGIIACAKHFCGHGDTNIDSHLELPIINHSIDHLHNMELYPFKTSIKCGVQSIMTAHLHVPAIDNELNKPISLSKNAITNLLIKRLKFDGLIITDALDMKGVTKYFKDGQAELQAFLAGNDILLMSEDVPKAIDLIKKAIEQKIITIDELNKRVLKILKLKEKLNLNKQNNIRIFNINDFHTKYAYDLQKKLNELIYTKMKVK